MAGGSQNSDEAIVGINITPLVDVTLVLLIIFMVTAQMIVKHESIPLDLPKAATGSEQQTIFSAVLTKNGEILVDSTPVSKDDLIFPLARDAHQKNPELRAVIKADSEVSHGRVMHILDLLKQAGIQKIAFGVSPGPAASVPNVAPK